MATGRLNTANTAVQLGTTATSLYVVPTGNYAVFNVSLTNTSASAVTIQLALSTSASPSNIADWIEYGTTIQPKGVFERTGLVAQAGMYVVGLASTGAVINATVYGIETSTS
jgi:hypothetical protein